MMQKISHLYFLCQCLGPDKSDKQAVYLKQFVLESNSEFNEIISLANKHLLSPALYAALIDRQLRELVNADYMNYLQSVYQANLSRNQKMKFQACEAIFALNKQNIQPVILKSGVYFFNEVFSSAGSRVRFDVDLLIDEPSLPLAHQVFSDLGYQTQWESERPNCHHPIGPLTRSGEPSVFELHSKPRYERIFDLLAKQGLWQEIEYHQKEEVSFGTLRPTSHVLLNILHAQISHEAYRNKTFSLQSLHDFVTYVDRHDDLIDWERIKELMHTFKMRGVLNSYLFAAKRLFGFKVASTDIKLSKISFHYLLCMLNYKSNNRLPKISKKINRLRLLMNANF